MPNNVIEPLKPPSPPAGLRRSGPGRRLWRDVTSTYVVRIDGLRLLEMACRTADELAVIDKALESAEPLVPGPRGRLVPNPLLEEARRHRATLMRALSQLGIEVAEGKSDAEAGSVAGRRLAAARWRRYGR